MSAVPKELLNLDRVKIDPAWALRVPQALATRGKVLPFAALNNRVYVACLSEQDSAALQAVQRYVKLPVVAQAAEPASLDRALARVFANAPLSLQAQGSPQPGGPRGAADSRNPETDDTAVSLCDELLYAAILRQASDIHIDPDHDGVEIRFRVDGVLESYRRLPTEAHGGMLSRFKVLSEMDIAEKRAPQDGRFTHRLGTGGQEIDIRTATLPTRHGERMTLRLLALSTSALTLERLGMLDRDLGIFQTALDKPHGMILLTGPTGSGKTTTLYAAVRRLIGRESLNVITIEDPVEYDIAGVAQVEVDSADKVSFGKALRSVLRHDPDVVMIGEIRDQETADVAIKAALTGHLVFSTLHTNSAASAVTRLADMGVERFLIAATLRLSVAQRLVRSLCSHCRKPHELTTSEAAALRRPELAGRTTFEPAGCMYCAGRGFTGRLGLFEMMPVDETLSRMIAEGAEEARLLEFMRESHLPRLLDDALEKLWNGDASLRDVLSAVTEW